MSPNIFLLKESGEDNRAKRMVEEFNKKGTKPTLLNVFALEITDRGLFYNREKIEFKKKDIVWSISNSVITKKLSHGYSSDNCFIWPTPQVSFFQDKFLGNCFFTKNNIPTPKTVLLNKCDLITLASSVGGFPCIIKRTNGSKGTEVAIVNSKNDIEKFIENIYSKKLTATGTWKDDFCFILQEYIKESSGTDLRILCLKDEIVGGIKRTSQNGDFRANVSLGGSASAFEVPDELKNVCLKIMHEGNLFYAGIDFIQSDHGWLAIEVNTCAQFEGFEKATQINVAAKIVDALLKACR